MVMRSPIINVMAKAAEKAARGLRRDFNEVSHLQVSRKGPGDFVSNADLQAQTILREELGKARPTFGFYMEEDDGKERTEGKEERWIVDPLDGTSNFLHGIPHFCISIAAERAGEIVAGYVFNPVTNEGFWAEKGMGAFLDEQRLRVSGRSDLSECLMGTGLPFKGSRKSIPRTLKELEAVMPQVAGVRRMGSAALDLAYVAAGRLDGYWEMGLYLWDIAAGVLLVKEAGGFVGPLYPKTDLLKTGSLIAANTEVFDKLTALLQTDQQ